MGFLHQFLPFLEKSAFFEIRRWEGVIFPFNLSAKSCISVAFIVAKLVCDMILRFWVSECKECFP